MALRLHPLPKRALQKQVPTHLTISRQCQRRHLTTVRASSSRIPNAAAANAARFAAPTGTADEDVYACRLTPEYYRRYRDPSSHDALPQPTFASSHAISSQHSYHSALSSAASQQPHHSAQLAEFEKAWSKLPATSTPGGSSASISTSAAVRQRKSALLFPGSGSQYVGMTAFLLDNFKAARDVWAEAEDVSHDFFSSFHLPHSFLYIGPLTPEVLPTSCAFWSRDQKPASGFERNGPGDLERFLRNLARCIHLRIDTNV